jgi:endonuclease/exonuclease/phosphatase family metal-dependent hydrolase
MVRLILYNIEYCEGTTKNIFQYLDIYHLFRSKKKLDDRMIDFLKTLNPDILALIEVDGGGKRSKKRNEPMYFSLKLGFDYLVDQVKYATGSLFSRLPVLKHQENALLSKYPISAVKYHFFSRGAKKIVIDATLSLQKDTSLLVVHLSLFKRTRLKQLNELVKIVNSKTTPVILVGDFNTFKEQELDLLLSNTNLLDAYSFNSVKSSKYTEPSWRPKYRLDNILISPEIKINNYEIIEAHLSDHLPVLIDFELK